MAEVTTTGVATQPVSSTGALQPPPLSFVQDNEGHEVSVLSHDIGGLCREVAGLPDGRVAILSGYGMGVWDPASNGVLRADAWQRTSSLVVLPDGRVALYSSTGARFRNPRVELTQPATGARLGTLPLNRESRPPLVALPGDRLACGSADHTVQVWNMVTGTCDVVLSGHTGRILALVVLADGRLASGSADKTVRVWDVAAGMCAATLAGYPAGVKALAVSSEGMLLAGSEGWDEEKEEEEDTANANAVVKLWDVASATCVQTLEDEGLWSLNGLAALPDGRVVTATHNFMAVWQGAPLQCKTVYSLKGMVYALAVLPNGSLVWSEITGGSHNVRVLNVPRGGLEPASIAAASGAAVPASAVPASAAPASAASAGPAVRRRRMCSNPEQDAEDVTATGGSPPRQRARTGPAPGEVADGDASEDDTEVQTQPQNW